MSFGDLKVQDLIYEDASNNEITVVIADLATKANPVFSGTVTVPTATAGDNSTKAASTAFVVASFAPKASPAFTGNATGVNLTLSGNLTVNGTTTTIDTTTLQVEDKNIEIGKVSIPSDTTADGGGWSLLGSTTKTFNWVNATDAWTSSEHIQVASGKTFIGDGSTLTALNASNISSGTVPTARLGSGTANSANFLRGDGSWQAIATDKIEEGNTSVETVDTGSDGHVKITTEGTERVRIANDGKVGINTTSPNVYGIHIDYSGTSESVYLKTETGTINAIYGAAGALGCGLFGTLSNHTLNIYVNNAERYRVGTNGQLGVGGANYGSSGQVLTSGGSGAAPSWTAPAAGGNTFTAVADGAIANNKAVIITTAGKVAQVTTTLTAKTATPDKVFNTLIMSTGVKDIKLTYCTLRERIIWIRTLTSGSYSGQGGANVFTSNTTIGNNTFASGGGHQYYMGANNSNIAYDPDTNQAIIAYGASNDGYCVLGTVSGSTYDEFTYGTAVQFASEHVSGTEIVYDTSNNKVVIIWRAFQDSNKLKAVVGTVSGTSISFGTPVSVSGVQVQTNTISACFDSNANKVVIFFGDVSDSYKGKAVVGTVSGTSISFGTVVTFASSTDGIRCPEAVFDSNANKCVVTYCIDGGSNEKHAKAIVATVSGTSVTFGSELSWASSGSTTKVEGHTSCFDPATNNVYFCGCLDNDNNRPYLFQAKINGTSLDYPSGTSAYREVTSMAGDTDGRNISLIATSAGKIFLVTTGSSSYGYRSQFETATSATNLTDGALYVGYADQAYTNGQTATIKTTGNNVDTLSGLTAGTKYYVQPDGTLGTSTGTPPCLAGLALSSSTLLIREGKDT